MASPTFAAFCWNFFGPRQIKDNFTKLQNTGLTTAILFAVHVGSKTDKDVQHEYGDLIFNNDRDDPANFFVRFKDNKGVFNPNNNSLTGAWPDYVIKLKQGGVNKLFFSIGGWDVHDFATIEYMLEHDMKDRLGANLDAMKNAFTPKGSKKCTIDGFDLDCEEGVQQKTIVQFSTMLFERGFQVTFCPYGTLDFWKGCMKTLWDSGKKISGLNLQCYAGGDGNLKIKEIDAWITMLADVVKKDVEPASLLLPGLAVMGSGASGEVCPKDACQTFAGWNRPKLGGGWLWRYDEINPTGCTNGTSLKAYVGAINTGLKGLKDQCK